MNVVEMYEKIKEVYSANEDNYYYIGLRFEDKEREIGEELEWSRHNGDREDEREFPEFGTEEYEELEELDGTSAWDMSPYEYKDEFYPGYGSDRIKEVDKERSLVGMFNAYHCYVIAGNKQGRHDDPDQGEILIKDAKVIAKIW